MYDPVVQLKSGGYLVINPTEALVSIDINSGRSTKEHGIEATALNTNLEAAREIARQLRLRDMAGLVVIDFIDMEYGSNVRKVEKAMKDALRNDRARIQVGRISGFGLMEMSRQRLRTGVLEATTRSCPHCDGTGLVRTASSAGLSALRLIEDEAAKGKGSTISLYASTEAAVYMLNAKRADLREIEERYGVSVEVIPEGEDEGAKMRIASSGPRPTVVPRFETIVEEDEEEYLPEEEDEEEEEFEPRESRDDREGGGKRRRRRRGGRGRDRGEQREEPGERESPEERAAREGREDLEDEAEDAAERAPRSAEAVDGEDRPKKRRRRGGRRRRGRREDGGAEGEAVTETAGYEGAEAGEAIAADALEQVETETPETVEEAPAPKARGRRKKAEVVEPVEPAETEAVEEPAPKPRSRRKKAEPEAEPVVEVEAEPVAEEVAEPEAAKPKRPRRKKADKPELATADADGPEAANDANGDEGDGDGPRRGWWQRTFGE
jgi:ribonuclease E